MKTRKLWSLGRDAELERRTAEIIAEWQRQAHKQMRELESEYERAELAEQPLIPVAEPPREKES